MGLWTSDIEKLADLIRQLEEPHHGILRFASFSGGLHVENHGWHEVYTASGYGHPAHEHFDAMAKELDDAVTPIREKYAAIFRQMLANASVELAAESLKKDQQ